MAHPRNLRWVRCPKRWRKAWTASRDGPSSEQVAFASGDLARTLRGEYVRERERERDTTVSKRVRVYQEGPGQALSRERLSARAPLLRVSGTTAQFNSRFLFCLLSCLRKEKKEIERRLRNFPSPRKKSISTAQETMSGSTQSRPAPECW